MSKAPPARKPMTSGFCNPTLPRTKVYDPHQRCQSGCACTAPHCPCAGHRCDGDSCTAPPPHDIPETPMTTAADPVPVTEPAPVEPQTPPEEPETREEAFNLPDLTPDPLTLPDAVAAYRAASRALQDALTTPALKATDWKAAIRFMRDLEAATWVGKDVHSSLAQHVYLTGEHGQQQVEGVPGMVMIGRGRERKSWDHTGVAHDYVAAKIEATGGELPDPGQVVEWVLEAAAPSYWRVTPLREAGLDPEDYCTSEPGKVSISIPKEDRLD